MFDFESDSLSAIAQVAFCDTLPNLSLYHFEQVTSTNDQAWNLRQHGASLPLATVAQRQSSGRGQWGRQWQSEPGGLYLSLLVPVNIAAKDVFHLTLWSVWGIAHLLAASKIPVRIKWPNDLVLEQYKLGGIKCETKIYQGQITEAVIGVGINWNNPVPATGIQLQPYLRHRAMVRVSSLEDLLCLTLQGLALGYERYHQEGINAILAGYEHYFANRGQVLALDQGNGTITGINADGELCVQLRSAGAISRICLPPGATSLGYQELTSKNVKASS